MNTLTTGQRNALNALYRNRRARGPLAYCRPEGVQERTLFALVSLGLARWQKHPSGASFRLTFDGLALAQDIANRDGGRV